MSQTPVVIDPNVANNLKDGSLFYGSFRKFGDMWFAVTFWNVLSCGLIYIFCGIIASIIARKFKFSTLVPVFTLLYGMIVGFSTGAISGLAIAAIYTTGPFIMSWHTAAAWGLGLTFFHVLINLGRGLFR
eukprot:TRINITY_DN928_c0_g1_i1.p1 TRINITY_DN928_c0_g1~~TRINITY_DN928_c0_g1_i1.p1  ORF type:complete len:130 (-),score=18.31 TRINITY_DN928_c0_g1_i1:119-508(-)